MNIFTFHLTTKGKDYVLPITQFGATEDAARKTIVDFNLKGIDWTDRELKLVDSDALPSFCAEPNVKGGVETKLCGCRFNWNDKFYESQCAAHEEPEPEDWY